ncbi:dynein regulatory complex subunit 3-like isoform X1 [Belonocnema kinseyi]|uniref:dynein regulatory complex subunit 3-like isoform X1 n=1 Tax=Belonocnema kinseyi TaxID=2817044 RepID=UPI00143D15E5|nr:dynein regulatory complex subunit 3-like isoform X1 [Belonocnema kinseyi]XP_033211387.1 dynein regulatory complex subunit 3-like isoform X1 [Belonocnema kinseyi]
MTHEGKEPVIFQNSSEPNVISHDLLVNLVIDQGPRGEAGKLFQEDGIKLEEVKEIRIEYLNILNINHLWVMKNLVKLKLCSNIIEKIENLEELVNLKELDLSFNRISVMENLNHLLNLEILLLYGNKIEEVEGIDDLAKLQILSLGKNVIKTQDHVMYLRKFKNLRSFNMEGNPCTEEEGYLDYLIAYIPQIVYLQYKMITEEQRKNSAEKYYRAISNLEEKEAKEKEIMDAKKAFEDHVAQVSISYVEYLDGDHLFDQMFESDKEGRALMSLNEETEEAYEQYKRTFSEQCHELFELGLKEQERRTEEIRLYEETVNKGKEDAQKEAQLLMDKVMERKTEIFSQVSSLMEAIEDSDAPDLQEKILQAKNLSEEFEDLISKTWTKLMHKEITLHEQLEDINEVFKINMSDLVSSFFEAAQGHFSAMRNAETEYNDNLTLMVTNFMNNFGDEADVPPEFQEICGSKDILTNNFGASHEMHLQVIDGREDRMIGRLKSWLEALTEEQIEEERRRNRNQVLEISHFLEFQREEFNKLQERREAQINEDDANVLAALED